MKAEADDARLVLLELLTSDSGDLLFGITPAAERVRGTALSANRHEVPDSLGADKGVESPRIMNPSR